MEKSDWISISVHCRFELSQRISDVLEEHGAQSTSTLARDSTDRTTISALFGSDFTGSDSLRCSIEYFKSDDDLLQVFEKNLPDRDWVQQSQDAFTPLLVNEKLWITAPWHDVDEAQAKTVVINPGMSFGTGHHATTRMCVEFLSDLDLSGCKVMDFGCGSGILAITALVLGAEFAWGVDIDPIAIDESINNAERNGVRKTYIALTSEKLTPNFQADIVVANLFLDALIELSGQLESLVKSDGWLVLSGILCPQVNRLRQAFTDSFNFSVVEQDNWAMLAARKNDRIKIFI